MEGMFYYTGLESRRPEKNKGNTYTEPAHNPVP